MATRDTSRTVEGARMGSTSNRVHFHPQTTTSNFTAANNIFQFDFGEEGSPALNENNPFQSSVFDSPEKNSVNEIQLSMRSLKLVNNNKENVKDNSWPFTPLTPVEQANSSANPWDELLSRQTQQQLALTSAQNPDKVPEMWTENVAGIKTGAIPKHKAEVVAAPPAQEVSSTAAVPQSEALPKDLEMLLQLGYPLNKALIALHPKPSMKFSVMFWEFLLNIKKCALDGFLDIELIDQPISPQALVLVYQVVIFAKVTLICRLWDKHFYFVEDKSLGQAKLYLDTLTLVIVPNQNLFSIIIHILSSYENL